MPQLRLQNGKYKCIINPSEILLTYDLGTNRGYFRIGKDTANPDDEFVVERSPNNLNITTEKYELTLEYDEDEDQDPQSNGRITLFSRSVEADGEIHHEALAYRGGFPQSIIEKFQNFIENPHEIGEPSANVEVYPNASNNPAGAPNARRRRDRKTRKQRRQSGRR